MPYDGYSDIFEVSLIFLKFIFKVNSRPVDAGSKPTYLEKK